MFLPFKSKQYWWSLRRWKRLSNTIATRSVEELDHSSSSTIHIFSFPRLQLCNKMGLIKRAQTKFSWIHDHLLLWVKRNAWKRNKSYRCGWIGQLSLSCVSDDPVSWFPLVQHFLAFRRIAKRAEVSTPNFFSQQTYCANSMKGWVFACNVPQEPSLRSRTITCSGEFFLVRSPILGSLNLTSILSFHTREKVKESRWGRVSMTNQLSFVVRGLDR